MIQQKSSAASGEVMDAISRFLAAPPEGTPAEIIEAFNSFGGGRFLPPKLFLETVEQAPVAISITDASARILYVNHAFEALTGYQRDEVIGHNESMLSSRSTPLSVYQELWKTIQARQVWQGTLVNHKKCKEEYLAELVISPVLTPGGEVSYYLGMHRDITAVHQLGQRLKFQKSLTEAALDAAPMVVAMITAERKVLLDNHAYKALLGDCRGVEPAGLFLDALEQQIDFDLAGACRTGKGFTNVEIRLDLAGSAAPRWFSCSAVRVDELDEAAQNYFKQQEQTRYCLLLIANEVTGSRKRINEVRLNMIRAGMAEQQMVETMREAISGAIFKMQVPFNIIRAALAMPGTGSDQCGVCQVLHQALESGNEAMESLQAALPSRTAEQASMVNINEILHEVMRLSTERLLASGVVVDWRPATVLSSVTGRPNALRGLFKYLIDNAIQAVNESGQDYREIRLQTRQLDQELVVEVMDNGPGIPEAMRLKVFEPFFCGWSRAGEHAGMGLTMAQEVILGHGGSIEIDADFCGGCRVFVRLPINGMGGV
ncbi:nitrogen fixation negative regulator NifL [Sedimenticola hydrogenitrophicus]|uniref:nitrogen fixation negative regulator NifL n=1 Tax=Sedimenticola hydrogenitrophicus TaxID=2967975 RepID=UPI0023AFC5F5|nr:nitrogen fixation negative regulator NifL [Sedimenticola hydrogenitrophicus]